MKTTELYGCEWPTSDRQAIELDCFRDPPVDGLGRYGHLRAAIDVIWNTKFPSTLIWNDWSELMLETFCDEDWVTVTGPAACVTGDTRILDPLTGKQPTVKELIREKRAPVVMTLCGPVLASVPFLKGEEELYEVKLSNGSKFKATLNHRVLLPDGTYERVCSLSIGERLLGYEHGLPRSTSGNGLLTRVLDALCFRKKASDFQDGYQLGYCYNDEQPQEAATFSQEFFPSYIGVQGHSPFPQSIISRILRESQSGPLSSLDFWGLATRSQTFSSLRCGVGTQEHGGESFRSFSRFASRIPLELQAEKRAFDSVYKHCRTPSYLKIQETTIKSITCIGEQNYYDLSVPSVHHYFAEGAIHHNSWKTTCAAMYGVNKWYASPHNTIVIFTSSTLDGLRRRVWKEVSKFWRLRPLFGNPVQSRNCIQYEKGSDAAGLFGIAVDKGDVEKAIGKIIGFHNTHVIVIVDEMPFVPEAIVEACVNLQSGAQHFQFIGIGNATDQLDPHGRMSEPKGGWDSVSVESEKWETKRGVCVHLDGLKSPNIVDKTRNFPGLINQNDLDTTAEIYGYDSPQFWQMRRGYWPPDSIQKTVLTMPMIVRARAQESCFFDSSHVNVAGLDPAFEGGDRCSLRLAKCGNVEGKKTLLLGRKFVIKTTTSPDDPQHYQIVRETKNICEGEGVLPYYFGLDSTGEGGGLASIYQREWNREILLVEFGGRPPRTPVSTTNPKRADEEYDRQVTFLWFFFRLLLQNEQIKGLDDDTKAEFCRRWWAMKGPYISLETKAKMKERTRKSPDDADAVTVLCQVASARDHLVPSAVAYTEDRPDSPWKRFMKKRSMTTEYVAATY